MITLSQLYIKLQFFNSNTAFSGKLMAALPVLLWLGEKSVSVSLGKLFHLWYTVTFLQIEGNINIYCCNSSFT